MGHIKLRKPSHTCPIRLNCIDLNMLPYPVVIGSQVLPQLAQWLREQSYSQILVLTDHHTQAACYLRLREHLPPHAVVTIEPGEQHKTLDTCQHLWQAMTERAMDRRGLLINLGGGVIGDMGGFVASTYKRGMDFVQVPTTLLAQVDASVGGKLGIDFMGYKNHIGLYGLPQGVYIDPAFLATLPPQELRSGFAEVIKHHLIADAEGWQRLRQYRDLARLPLGELIEHSVAIKTHIVLEDPQEKGLRKALNFGHTIGHALETARLSSEQPLLHGEAIAVGMIAEAYLSQQRGLLTLDELQQVESYLRGLYPPVSIPTQDFEPIYQLSRNDKKNFGGRILCTLLDGLGQAAVNQEISQAEIEASLRYYVGEIKVEG